MQNELETKILPALPLRGLTAFPHMLIHFDVGRVMSIKALEASMKNNQEIFLTAQMDIKIDIPESSDLYTIGTICIVKQILRLPGDSIRVLVEGKTRARVLEWSGAEPLYAKVEEIKEPNETTLSQKRKEALVREVQDKFESYAEYTDRMSKDIVLTVAAGGELAYLADYIAQNISIEYTLKQEFLEELNTVKRMQKVIRILASETEILKIQSKIQEKLKHNIDKNQKDYYLREQIKILHSELGEQDVIEESEEYMDRIYSLNICEEATEKLIKEAKRLSKMNSSSAEASVIRTYLDTCLELPWNIEKNTKINIKTAEKRLNHDHYGLKKVKQHILEFLAVKKLSPDIKGQVLCLVGPPGVGKTSIARSIAQSTGRDYARVSLGGVRDEADIRGHRKTYIGAMPGRIINAIKQAGSRNCLILLDEIDKMGNDFRGDPASAMLEVLDIEQNSAFRDHFIEIPFDLSDILFITTANDITKIPRPLLDRMQVIELSSYTREEKLQIAKKHLLPKQIIKNGLNKSNILIPDNIINEIVSYYVKEAGVRKLEQYLAKICRKVAKIVVDNGENTKVKITPSKLEEFLGTARYKKDDIALKDEIGVVNGLAWTSVGGEILQVEVNVIPGTGKTVITGNLGNVMEESAKAALTYVRSIADSLDIDVMFYKNNDIHIHFPEAATPKDGPSAGIAITTAIISALTEAPVRCDIAMTGEVTIRGRVLPIGGLKEKTMAAYSYGIKTVIIPKANENDLRNIESVVSKNVEFVIADDMSTVIKTAINFSKRNKANKKNNMSVEHVENKSVASICQ